MQLSWHSKAKEDLKKFEQEDAENILEFAETLEQNPLGDQTSIVSKQGLEAYRLKIKTENLDHRLFFDIKGQKIIVLGVLHRDNAYTKESLTDLQERQ